VPARLSQADKIRDHLRDKGVEIMERRAVWGLLEAKIYCTGYTGKYSWVLTESKDANS